MQIHHRLISLLFSPLMAFIAVFWVCQFPALAQIKQIEPEKAVPALSLPQSDPDDLVRIIVHMKETAVLPNPTAAFTRLNHRIAVIQTLQQTAATSQAALRQQLDSWQTNGDIKGYHPFWIINAILVTSTAKLVEQIAARPDVAAVMLDERQRYFDPLDTDFWQMASQTQQLTASTQPPATATRSHTTTWGIDRINAPKAWHGLGIDGSGIVIAIMDSGVDWQHPDLLPNYRGNLGGGNFDHSGSWYHTTYPSITEPMDALGHGTHVAGTAVGQNGIGTAPGTQWIAVSIADALGYIYDSDVHRGFEWLMAPNGDPALAPDIVNNSWGGNPYSTSFIKDINALQSAGIITVFSAGNSGPFTQTIESPASLTETLAIAATDDIDEVAWFSSRGPSVLTDEQNPWIAAPGVAVLSSLPNGRYGLNSGTSMAAPHVSGAIALLLSANPSLTRPEILDILAQTAVPISTTHPNNASGWGLLDVYAAVGTQVETGVITGLVHSEGTPLAQAAVVITSTDGAALEFNTDENGRFQAELLPGIYNSAAHIFGYTNETAQIAVTAQQTTTHDFNLTPLPGGVVSGIIRSAAANEPITAAISVLNTPVHVMSDENGRYQLNLPSNQYKLAVTAPGFRSEQVAVLATTGQTLTQNFALDPAPTILLVDGGKWYFNSYASYYQNSLAALNYAFDTWTVRNPYQDVPTLNLLANYDVVVWSNPLDSPGYIGAGTVISDYLGLGGNLLISGQNIGIYDGSGFDVQHWWYGLLGAHFRGKTAVSNPLTGTPDTLFSGINPTLNGAGSAQNQSAPDQSSPRSTSLSQSTFQYADGLDGGLYASRCRPFHIAYFGFGLEGLPANERNQIIDRSFATFALPRQNSGVRWEPTTIDDFAVSGSHMVYTLTLRNMSETLTDTFSLSITSGSWSSALVTQTLKLGTCQSGQTVLRINVPDGLPNDFTHDLRLTAVSANYPTTSAQLNLHHKTPGDILLVDDDRWYNQEDTFSAMLDAMDLTYDVWDIGWDNNVRGSPPQDILNAYDFVLWFTAYDWFAPVTAVENQRLTHYLDQGGRLFLTSQDFLYYHRQTKLAQHYLGVTDYDESVEPNSVYGAGNAELAPDLAGPLPLDHTPYQNNSDGIIPRPGSQPYLWLDQGMAGGTATSGSDWRTVFLGFPLEKLNLSARTTMMNSIVGWLSDLGNSTFAVDRPTSLLGEPRTYTVTLRNLPQAVTNQVKITNTLPIELLMLPGTISGGALFNPAANQLTWSGELPPNGQHQIVYQAIPQTAVTGDRLDNHLQIYYEHHNLAFDKTAPIWIQMADLSQSAITAVSQLNNDNQTVTYTLHIINNGLASADSVVTTMHYYTTLQPITETLYTSAGAAFLRDKSVIWEGILPPGNDVTVTLALTRTFSMDHPWLPATAVLTSPSTPLHLIYNQLYPLPYNQYFPLIAKIK